MSEDHPFQPPASSLDPGHSAIDLPDGPYGPFRNNETLATVVIVLVILFSGVMPLVTNAINIAIYGGHPLAETAAAQAYIGALSFSGIPIMVTFICFGVWIVRSAKNAHLFTMVRRKAAVGTPIKAPVMRDTPGWAVGWYFIPIASLWRPYLAMKDIFAASTTRASQEYLLPIWWALWLLSFFTDQEVSAANNSETFASAAAIMGVTIAIGLGLAVIAIQLVRTLTRMQMDAAVDLTEVWKSIPPARAPQDLPNSVGETIAMASSRAVG